MEDVNTSEGLKRVIGVPGLALTIVSGTIGAGIFALPAIVSLQIGAFGVVVYLFCGIMMAAIMFCYAETGSRITSTGGSYAYVQAAFGNLPGFIINWLFVIGWCALADAALMNLIADSLSALFPAFTNVWFRAALFLLLLGGMAGLNIRGAKQGVALVKFITVIKLLPLFGIIIFGSVHVNSSNLQVDQLPSFAAFGNTALVLFFAFAGFESALGVSGEIKNPKRTVPLGILLGGLLVLVVYLLLQAVTQGALGAGMAQFKDAPLAAVAQKIVGPVGATIILVTAAISCFGTVGGDVLNTPRVLFAGAKDGLFPRFLGKVHPTFSTPYVAITTFTSLVFILSVSGGFKQLAVLASAAILLVYLAVVAATVQLRIKNGAPGEKTFKLPGGFIIPVVAIATIIWLLTSLTKQEILATVVFVAVVCIIYFLMKKFQKEKLEVQPGMQIHPGEE